MSSSLSQICKTIDFVFLQDLSGSYTDDLPILKSQIANVIATVEDIDPLADFGVASFIDKPFTPFGGTTDYIYQTHLGITSDNNAVINAVNSLSTRSGLDEPESQLDGLMMAALRMGEVGYRADTKRIVMLSTDSSFHKAGDYVGGTVNNGDGILDPGEDYPAISQVAAALAAGNIFPVFSVTAAQKALYESLVADLGTGAVVVLTSNSDNFSDAVRLAVAKACGQVTHEGDDGDDTIEGTSDDDGIYGIGGDDDLWGKRGDDVVDGGSGNDVVRGGVGRDDLRGGSGNDILIGGKGKDVLKGGFGDDTMTGGAGRDTFIVNPDDGTAVIVDFQDTVDKLDLSAYRRYEGVNAVLAAIQSGSDVVINLPDGTVVRLLNFSAADFGLADVLVNPETDAPDAIDEAITVTSGETLAFDPTANDTDPNNDALTVLSVGAAAHGTAFITSWGNVKYVSTSGFVGTDSFTYTVTDGAKTDTATVTVTVTPQLIGDAGDNVLIGTAGADDIYGKGGNDTISGLGERDRLFGGAGHDWIDGGLKPDEIHGGSGRDTMYGGGDDDTIYGDGSADLAYGGVGDDKIFGGNGNDALYGDADNDEIFGGKGDDVIFGGTGNDQITGDIGNDTIDGGAGDDEILATNATDGTGDDDVLTGGAGVDTFIFELSKTTNRTGNDIITDYDIANDTLLLDGNVLVKLTDSFAGCVIEAVGGDMILVEGVLAIDLRPTIAGLVEGDF